MKFAVAVRVDEAGERSERQVGAVERVRDQERVAGRQFERPEIGEFDQELVFAEERRADHLIVVVKSIGARMKPVSAPAGTSRSHVNVPSRTRRSATSGGRSPPSLRR
jgi:hypothetical protein